MYGNQRKALPRTLTLTQSHNPRNIGERREHSSGTLPQLAIQIL